MAYAKGINKGTSTGVKGFLAVIILIHHYVLQMADQGYLWFLNNIGFLCVAWFFFMSGYGLMYSFKRSDKVGVIPWLSRRVLRIYIPFIVANICVGMANNLLVSSGYTVKQILISSFTLVPIYGTKMLWYIQVQLFCYIIFAMALAISGRVKNEKNIVMCRVVGAIILGYVVVCYLYGVSEWKWNTVLCFPLGMYFSCRNDSICLMQKKNTIIKICLSILFIVGMVVLDSWSLQTAVKQVLTVLIAFVFVMLIISICSSCSVHSKILEFFGTISYEFYIINLPAIMIANSIMGRSGFLSIVAAIVIDTVLASVCYYLSSLLIKGLSRLIVER